MAVDIFLTLEGFTGRSRLIFGTVEDGADVSIPAAAGMDQLDSSTLKA